MTKLPVVEDLKKKILSDMVRPSEVLSYPYYPMLILKPLECLHVQ